MQVLALFTPTEVNSTLTGKKQADCLERLLRLYPQNYQPYHKESTLFFPHPIQVIPAIENASVFFEEHEPLEEGFKRFDAFLEVHGKPLYVSLTWNMENRFGGGNMSKIGLKADGERLLEYLSEKRIPVDLSHTSDLLASDILNKKNQNKYDFLVLASHSNFRSVNDNPRNLPDEFALEIKRNRGIIGINFVRRFLSSDATCRIIEHVDHGYKLGLEDVLSFGADFFCDLDIPRSSEIPFFFEEYGNSSVYPKVLEELGASLIKQVLDPIAFKNANNFIDRVMA
ncbi:MAG: dipeptidase [Chlamydiales bacterium]